MRDHRFTFQPSSKRPFEARAADLSLELRKPQEPEFRVEERFEPGAQVTKNV
jgi:hypothetical protein